MEDKLNWTDTVSVYALKDAVVDERILAMWGHLRAAVVYFMRYQPGQHTEENIDAAQTTCCSMAAWCRKLGT